MTKLLSSVLAVIMAAMVSAGIALPFDIQDHVSPVSHTTTTTKRKSTPTTKKATVKPTVDLGCLTTTTTTTTTTTKARSYSDDDLYVMTHVMHGEAGGHGEKLLSYVGSVVLNRVAHKSFPNTIRGVVFQKGQYACTWDGNYNKTPDALTKRVAIKLLTGGSVLPKNVVYQAGFRQGSGVYAVVDGVYFCYA